MKGPSAAPKTRASPPPSFTQLLYWIRKTDRWLKQYTRSKYTKYAGARYRYICLKQSNEANSRPLQRRVDCLRAKTSERMSKPYKKPLYWKCIWSMIRSPGDRSIEIAAAWDKGLDNAGDVCTYLSNYELNCPETLGEHTYAKHKPR